MEKLFLAALVIAVNFVQAQTKIKLDKGQKFETNTVMTMSMNMELMGQSIEIISNATATNQIEVKMTFKDSFVMASTLSKMKLIRSYVGQDMNYDSENPADKESEMGQVLSKSIGQITEVTINESGKIINTKKPMEGDEAAKMLSTLSEGDGNDVSATGVKGMFANFNILKVKAGDVWKDSTVNGKNKMVNTYRVKEIKGDEISVNIVTAASTSFTTVQQGAEVLVTNEIKSNGDFVYERATGLLKQSKVATEATGTVENGAMVIPTTSKETIAFSVKKM